MTRNGGTLALRLIAVAVVAALGFGGYWLFFASKASSDVPARVSDLEPACASPGKYYPGNDAYTGTGPRPIAVFRTGDAGFTTMEAMDLDVPAHWNSVQLAARTVQVIACLDEPEDGEYLTECTFESDTLKPYRGVYDVTLYEAKTGKEIGTERISGSSEPQCPSMTFTKHSTDRIHTEPGTAEYRAVLGKYAD
ncbi:hypothetical protein [Amycolatopsis sp. NPDC051071]|uniref:hypothetical protein n=1 Tax=Amycolatopsis sp. NPDC051071 TaxID=3154637 RepID=UPI0034221AB8